MRSNLKLVVNNPHNKIEEKHFFEKDELKIILDLYAKMVDSDEPIKHPLIEEIFSGKKGSSYFKLSN